MIKLSLYFGIVMLSSNFSSTTQPREPNFFYISPEEQRFVELANRERALLGLDGLEIDPVLVEVCRSHSREMAELGYFGHKSPTPGKSTPMDRYLAHAPHKPAWAYLGENLLYSSLPDVELGHKTLMDSENHRANILNPAYRRIGVGTYEDSDGRFWMTQMFLAKID